MIYIYILIITYKFTKLLMLSYSDGFGIKQPTKFDMPLNKKPEPQYK